MYSITVSEEIRERWPQYRGAAVYATVENTAFDEDLWAEIALFTEHLRANETNASPRPRNIRMNTSAIAS